MQTLISATELKRELNDPNLVILDCRFYLTDLGKGAKEYAKGHLPDAIFVDVHHNLASEETELSGRHPLPSTSDFSAYLQSIGIGSDSNVVVYDDMSGAIAARAWWMLSQNGVNTRVLDGGLNTWLRLGEPLSTSNTEPKVSEIKLSISFPWAISETAVLENIETEAFQLLDARANDRYQGQNETIDALAGHIPGAFNRPFSNNLDENGLFLNLKVLADSFDEFDKENSLIHYCGSGITACHNVLANAHAGKDDRRVFIGSWSQWSKRMLRLMSEQKND